MGSHGNRRGEDDERKLVLTTLGQHHLRNGAVERSGGARLNMSKSVSMPGHIRVRGWGSL